MLLNGISQAQSLDTLDLADTVIRTLPVHDQLLYWAAHEWQKHYPDQPNLPVWAADECANKLALQRIKAGRKLKGNAHYTAYKPIFCPYIMPVEKYHTVGRREIFTALAGAFIFTFENSTGSFDVLFGCAYKEDNWCGLKLVAIALVPPEFIHSWSDFQEQCERAVHRLERSEKVYVVGGDEESFEPNVEWEDVILPDTLKIDLRNDIETFFTKGAQMYRQLELAPFRKLLLVGPPGTGKSMICAALAKLALAWKCIVVYVSSSQKDSGEHDGNTFNKIQRALRLAANSRYPVLVIVEELDIYLRPQDKSQILNVLDGFETPSNRHGTLLVATTNYPEMIDERIARRPGRIDRIIHIPPINDLEQAVRMMKHYMGSHWQESHSAASSALIGQTGAFAREVALYARMFALQQGLTEVTLEMLQQSVNSLREQLTAGELTPA